jgi:hypothetical protein
MAEARRSHDWDLVSSLLASMSTIASGNEYSPLEFHPFRHSDLPSVADLKPEDLP